MNVKTYPEIKIGIVPNSSVYVFSIQARNMEDAAVAELTVGQIEAARNAAAATLETIGARVDSTASIVNVPASAAKTTLTLTPTVESSNAEEPTATTEETNAADQQTDQAVEGVE